MILRDPPEWAVNTGMWVLYPIWGPAVGIILLVALLDSWWQADFGPKRGVWERHFAWWPVDAEPEPGDRSVRVWWEGVYRTRDWTGYPRYCRVLPTGAEDDGFVTIHPRTGIMPMKTCETCDRHSRWGAVPTCCPDCIHRVKGEPQDYWKPIVLGEPCASCTGRVRANNPARCAECSPTLHNNLERTPAP